MSDDIQQQTANPNQEVIQLYQQGRYEEALNTLNSARNLLSQTVETEKLTLLALLYAAKGDNRAAQPLYQKVLELMDITPAEDTDLTDSITSLAFLYTSQENYEIAELLYQQALDLRRKNLGEEHQDFADSLTHLALLQTAKSNHAGAEQFYQQAQKIYSTALGENHPYVATCLNNRAETYEAMGKYPEAAQCLEWALTIERGNWGESHLEIATSLNNLAGLYRELGKHTEAVNCLEEALEIEHSLLGENNSDYATTLNNLGMLYRELGNYPEGEQLLQKSLDIEKHNLENNDPNLIPLLKNLVDVKAALGKYAESEPLLQQVITIECHHSGENSAEYADSLNNLAGLYRELGKYQKAQQWYEQAQQIRSRTLGKKSLDYAIGLHDLASLYQHIGHYAEAEKLHQESLEILRHNSMENQPAYATGLGSLAVLYRSLGRYSEAKQLHQQVLQIEGKTLGKEHPNYADSLKNFAGYYQGLGNYSKAEQLYQQALAIFARLRMDKHPESADIFSNLVSLYENISSYKKAVKCLQQTLEIEAQTLGTEHPKYATSLHNLASLYLSAGQYPEAERILQPALKIRQQVLGENHPEYANSLIVLASLKDRTQEFSEAERIHQQALQIICQAREENHPDHANALENLGLHYMMVGNYTDAESILKQALEIQKQVLGENNLAYTSSLGNLAEIYAATNRNAEAITSLERVEEINSGMMGKVFSIGSESQRMSYLKTLRVYFEGFLSLIFQNRSHSSLVVKQGFKLVLQRKGIGAEALAAQRDAVLGGRYPALVSKLEELNVLRRQIAQKSLAGVPSWEGLQEHQNLLAQWNSQKEELEVELARQIPEMRLQQQLRDTSWQDIIARLPSGTALVEFVYSRRYNFQAILAEVESKWKSAHYFAFILSATNLEPVQSLDLGEAKLIDQMVASFRESIIGAENSREFETVPTDLISEEIAGKSIALRKAIFDPLLKVIGDCKRLFIVPDGDLTKLPFEVLPLEGERRLIDEYRISYLSTSRDLLRFGPKFNPQPSKPLVFADPDFDFNTETATAPIEPLSSSGRQSRDLNREEIQFRRLPGTRVEGEKIAALLGVEPIMEKQVLETRLKASRSPQILHLATHGFFLQNQKQDLPQQPFAKMGRLSGANLENPLLRSGLALAGANTWLKKGSLPPEAEDGILTAEDVSGLDLLDTELVVLSACETGLGEVQTGEGVFGLRRAFVLAGAKTLVMSLWKVPDKQTEELMTDFYSFVLEGKPRSEALRQAQLEMKKKHTNPYYWGAFICQGEIAPLPKEIS